VWNVKLELLGECGERHVIFAQLGNTHLQIRLEFLLALTVLQQKHHWLDPRMWMIALAQLENIVPLEMFVQHVLLDTTAI